MAERHETRQYLTFGVANEIYGTEVKSVREILEMQEITRIPRTEEYLLGVMNVRGRVVPVVDLRLKFGLERIPPTVDSAIIVLEVAGEQTESLIGLLVDNVAEVLELGAEAVEPAPTVGTTVDGRLISGVGKRDEQFIQLLDIDAVFADEEIEIAKSALEPAAR